MLQGTVLLTKAVSLGVIGVGVLGFCVDFSVNMGRRPEKQTLAYCQD